MIKLNKRQINIIEKIKINDGYSSSDILKLLNEKISLITIKRDLDYLTGIKYIERKGNGRSTFYEKTNLGLLFLPVDAFLYNKIDPDSRNGMSNFNFSLFDNFPKSLFLEDEKIFLDNKTESYKRKIKRITPIIQSKELERFIIELSWKSSKIEGNTYTLLDTEKLIRDGIQAEGHTINETNMILNHKKAFYFIIKNLESLKNNGINSVFVEKVHELLTRDLGISRGVRNNLVGIIGTKYKPLDNKYQINEALKSLYKAINQNNDPYSKALTTLVGISYIQPFEDGNKRTARLLCNAILLASNCAPLSC